MTDHILTLYEDEAGKSFIAEFDDENGYYGGMTIPVQFVAGNAVFNGLQLSDPEEPMETEYGKADFGFTAYVMYKGEATPWGLVSHVIGAASLAGDSKSWTMPAGKLNVYDVCGMGFGAAIIGDDGGFLSMGDMIDIPLTMTRVESAPAARSINVPSLRKDFSNISLSTNYGFYKSLAVHAADGIAAIKIVSADNNAVIRKFSPKENNKKALKPCRKADKKVARQK